MLRKEFTEFRHGPYLFYEKEQGHDNIWKGIALDSRRAGEANREVRGKILLENDPELERSWVFQENNIVRAYAKERLDRACWPNPDSDTQYMILVTEYVKGFKPFSSSLTFKPPQITKSVRLADGTIYRVHMDLHGNTYAACPVTNELIRESSTGNFIVVSCQLQKAGRTFFSFLYKLSTALSIVHRTLANAFPNLDASHHGHNDPNADNIIVKTREDGEFEVVLIDLAKITDQAHPAWCSPEHKTGQLSPASDVYVLGLYALRLYYALPFHKRAVNRKLLGIASQSLCSNASERPTLEEIRRRILAPIANPTRWQQYRLWLLTAVTLSLLLLLAGWKIFIYDNSLRGRFGRDNGAAYFSKQIDLVREDRDNWYSCSQEIRQISESPEAWPELEKNAVHARAMMSRARFPNHFAPNPPLTLSNPLATLASNHRTDAVLFLKNHIMIPGDWISRDAYLSGIQIDHNRGLDKLNIRDPYESVEKTKILNVSFKTRYNPGHYYSLSFDNLPVHQLLVYVASITNRQLVMHGKTPLVLRGFISFDTYSQLLKQLSQTLPNLRYDATSISMGGTDWKYYTFFRIGTWRMTDKAKPLTYFIDFLAARLEFDTDIPPEFSTIHVRQLTTNRTWQEALDTLLMTPTNEYEWHLEQRKKMTLVISKCY